MALTVQLVDPLAQSVPQQWGRFVREHGLIAAWNPAALAAVARAVTRPLELALVRDGADCVALICVRYGGVGSRRAAYAAIGRRPRVAIADCSLPLAFSPGIAFAPGLPAAGRRAAVDAFLRAIGRERRGVAVVFRQIAREQLDSIGSGRRLIRRTAPVSVLENRWSTLDGYYASLPRERRRRFRRLLDAVTADADLDTLEAADAIDGVQASRLDHLTRLKHAGRRGVVTPIPVAYFDALSAAPGARYFGHREAGGGALLSFDLVLDDGARLVTTVTGALQDGAARSRSLYFDQYLREIAFAVERGLGRLEWGKGMIELKARFGSVTVPQYAVALAGSAMAGGLR
jgi:hypothetical protein